MKKRFLALVLTVTMVVGSMTACGGSDPSKDGPDVPSGELAVSGETEEVELHGIKYKKAKDLTTENIELTYFHFDQEETCEYLRKRFEELYPNIKVKAVYENVATYNDTLNVLVGDGNAPDVIMYSDADYALSNSLLADIQKLWDSDPETKEIASTINTAGIGTFQSGHRYAVPVKFFPSAMYIDLNVLKKLNIDAPDRNWTWSDMIDLIKKATVLDSDDGKAYYGCGFYNRLDSYYGIASSQDVIGEFGYDGEKFDLSAWAVGEQEFAELKQGGYIAPATRTIPMQNWMGDFEGWCGTSEHVALFTEAFWTFQNTWNTPDYLENYNMDIVPYVVPAVSKDDATADHHTIATIDFGGLSPSCKHPREAYELLKFMSFGQDGWKTRIEMYNDETQVNANGVALKHDVMPAPITTNKEVWDAYIDMYCKGMDETHVNHWREYFESCMQPIPFGWTSIAGYWNYCDEYFNSIGIHDLVDGGTAKAADYVDEATKKANYFHAQAMIDYFGPDSDYNVLSDEDVQKYTKMIEDNQ